MRSIGKVAVVAGVVVLASACSDGAGTPPPENTPPTAGYTHTCSAADCTFTSTSTDVAPGTIATYAWTFGDGGTADVEDPSHSYSVTAPTEFTVSLTVTDNEGATDVETQTITVVPGNGSPTADFTYTCSSADCTFTSTSTDVAPGTIATYAWTFGDGGTAEVNNPSHRYTATAPTDFTVTLTVTDNEGNTDVETRTITVVPGNDSPTASFTYSCNSADCSFISTSTDVPPGTIVTYAWTFGDGATAQVNNPSHRYTATAPTEFTVTLTVTDNQGATGVATRKIAVNPAPPANELPVARFVYSCVAGVCTFVNTSYDHGGRITGNAWTFGDGGTATETSPTHSYAVTSATEFTVTLTVTDNEGATNIDSQTFTIDPNAANQPPTASFTSRCYGEGCIFTNTSTDPAPGAIVSYVWSFGDGSTAEQGRWIFPTYLVTHVYAIGAPTTFTVTLTVTDNEGATAVSTQTLTLSPLPPAVQGCTTSGITVECVLDMTSRSTLKLKLLGVNCDIGYYKLSKISTPPPVGDQVFEKVCQSAVGQESGVFGGTLDEPWVYEAGSQARIRFSQGVPRPGEPPKGAPAGRLTGTFPDWTLSFDDGVNPGAPGEPNFTDLVVGVHATVR
jgi:PKD repeat protein